MHSSKVQDSTACLEYMGAVEPEYTRCVFRGIGKNRRWGSGCLPVSFRVRNNSLGSCQGEKVRFGVAGAGGGCKEGIIQSGTGGK